MSGKCLVSAAWSAWEVQLGQLGKSSLVKCLGSAAWSVWEVRQLGQLGKCGLDVCGNYVLGL